MCPLSEDHHRRIRKTGWVEWISKANFLAQALHRTAMSCITCMFQEARPYIIQVNVESLVIRKQIFQHGMIS